MVCVLLRDQTRHPNGLLEYTRIIIYTCGPQWTVYEPGLDYFVGVYNYTVFLYNYTVYM